MGEHKIIGISALRNVVFVFALLTLLVGSASAVSVQSAKFTWIGNDIQLVSKNNPIPAVLNFDISDYDDVSSIIIDASSMYNDIRFEQYYASITVNPSLCTDNHCSVSRASDGRQLSLRVSDPNINIKFEFLFKNGSTEEIEQAISLAFDNSKPLLKFIGTKNCDDDVCYAMANKPAKIWLEFEDSQATFNRKIVAFRLGGENSFVSECDGLSCYGFATPSCTTKKNIPLSVVRYQNMPSQDDAGNPVNQEGSFSVICDPDVPRITEKKVSSGSGLDAITVDDKIIIQLNVSETTSSSLNFSVNASSIGSGIVLGSCIKVEDYFLCTAEVSSTIKEAGVFNLPFEVSDIAGNIAKSSSAVKLLEISEQANVDLWNTGTVTQTTNSMFRKNMAVQRTFFADIVMKHKSSGVELVNVDKTSVVCQPTEINKSGNEGDAVMSLIMFDAKKNRVYAQVTLTGSGLSENNRYDAFSDLEYNCPLKLNSKRGSYFYKNSEEQNVTIKINLRSGSSLDRFVSKEIDASKNIIEDRKKLYEQYDQTLGKLKTVCTGIAGVEAVSGSIATIEGLLSTNPVTEGAGVAAGTSAEALGGVAKESSTPLLEACKLVSCQQGFQTFATDMLNDIPILNDVADYAGYSNFSSSLDPYKSEFIAAVSLCMPAWMYHQKVKNSIECSYLQCLTDGVVNYGASVSSCQDQKSFNTCLYNTGSLFDSIPGLSLLRDAGQRLASIVSDPLVLLGTAAPLACLIIEKGTVLHSVCNIYTVATTVPQILSTVQGIVSPPGNPAANCGIVLDYVATNNRTRIGNFPPEYKFSMKDTVGKDNTAISCSEQYCCVNSNNCKTGGVIAVPIWDFNDGGKLDYISYYDRSTGKLIFNSNSVNLPKPGTANYDKLVANKILIPVTDSEGNPVKDGTHILDPKITDGVEGIQTQKYIELKRDYKGAFQYARDLSIAIKERVDMYTPDFQKELAKDLAISTDYDYFDGPGEDEPIFEIKVGGKPGELKLTEVGEQLQSHLRMIYGDEKYDLMKDDNVGKTSDDKTRITAENIIKGKKDYQTKIDDQIKGDNNAQTRLEKFNDNVKSKAYADKQAKMFEQKFGTTKDTVRTLWGVGSGLISFRRMFDSDWVASQDSFLGKMAEGIKTITLSNAEEKICSSNLEIDNGVGEGIIMNELGERNYRSAAYISSRRSGKVSVPNTDSHYYDYWVEGGVTTYKKAGLKFSVIMLGPEGTVDMTKEITREAEPELSINVPYAFGGLGTSYVFNSSSLFNKVCIVFRTSNLEEYFDYVDLDNNMLCQTIIAEE